MTQSITESEQMSWNHRVIRRSNSPSIDPEWTYQIHEVYYNDDGSIESWSENPVAPMGENPSELQSEIRHFLAALNQPVLEEVEFNGEETLLEIKDEK